MDHGKISPLTNKIMSMLVDLKANLSTWGLTPYSYG